jgi:hypothetical protein
MNFIIGGIVLIGIILFMIEYSRKREGITPSPTTPSPNTVYIPPFFKEVNKCDYPLLWKSAEVIGNKTELDRFYKELSDDASKTICNNSNPENIKNQKEVCGYITDLATAYSGKILDTCPKNPEYDGDNLNKASICSLPKYYIGYKQMILNEVADKKMNKLQQQRLEELEKTYLDKLKTLCSTGNKNACIIKDAVLGSLPRYCYCSEIPPTVPPKVAAGIATF